MTQKLTNFLNGAKNKEIATDNGTRMHAILQRVVIDESVESGDMDIVRTIKQHPELLRFFTGSAKTEVPIAGKIYGTLASRRIDRLLINHNAKTIEFIDYKTDTDKTVFIEKYKRQLNEYSMLLRSAYPDYKITGYILWLHDWTLEQTI